MNFEKLVKRIPEAYQEVEYISSNGGCYIDTGIIPSYDGKTKVAFSFQMNNISSGQYQSLGSNLNLNFYAVASTLKFRANGTEMTDLDTNWHTVTMEKDNGIKRTIFDGVEYAVSASTDDPLRFCLFALRQSDDSHPSYFGYYKLKEFKMWDNNELVRDFIPCYRKNDNTVGMYDLVTNVFYTAINRGGSLSAGNDVYAWNDIPHYIHKTDTDTITTLPADIYPNDTTATVGLIGNMQQTSTPSPSSIITPDETGERTWNLFDVADLSGVRWATQYPRLLEAINLLPNGVYTMSISYELTSRNDTTDSSVCGWYIAKDSRVLSNIRRSWETAQTGEILTVVDTFTIDDNNRGAFTALYLYGCGINGVGVTGSANAENIMLNTGSTALPFEPYGIKIPISSASTTTPVYLGEVETTRRIFKAVFDGTENWQTAGGNFYLGTVTPDYMRGQNINYAVCSHYQSYPQTNVIGNVPDKSISFSYVTNIQRLYCVDSTFNGNATDFKSYLAQQYAAGTPVCIWYVLATPTTGIVNEPIRKIGDYADEVVNVSIPVTAGGDTISVDTTLQPSEVTVDYKGWHPVQSVHEKSKNLFDGILVQGGIANNGDETSSATRVRAYADVASNSEYTFSSSHYIRMIYAYNNATKIGLIADYGVSPPQQLTFTVPDGANKIGIALCTSNGGGTIVPSDVSSVMLNSGSTALPYEPYWN